MFFGLQVFVLVRRLFALSSPIRHLAVNYLIFLPILPNLYSNLVF